MKNKILKLEFLLLYVLLPGLIIFNGLGQFMFVFLWAATAYCMIIDKKSLFTSWAELWGWDQVNWQNFKPLLLRFMVAVFGMALFTLWYDPARFLFLPQNEPDILWRILILYPLLSALPQEYIFCRFFFKRYKSFFGQGWLMIIMSAIVFAYAHVLFINPVAPTLGFIAGLIFAHTYWKTKSLALVTIEHGLYGNAIFIIGLGYYFYSGGIS